MNKKVWITGVMVFVLLVMAGSVIAFKADENISIQQENHETDEAGERNVALGDEEVNDASESFIGESILGIMNTEDRGATEKDNSISVSSNKTGDLKSAEGILAGRIDNHSVEIKINGETQAFGLSDELQNINFSTGKISFKYYTDENGRHIISETDYREPKRGSVNTAEGVFSGQVDNHTVEILIGNEARCFGLDEGISFTGIKDGEEVYIVYQENEHGRIVIVKVERNI